MRRRESIGAEDSVGPVVEREAGRILKSSGVKKVIAGVSGGADSTAMLLALLACGCDVSAVHCNFHLRGDESDSDEEFCKRLCRKYGVTLEIVHFDVGSYMKANGVSLEMACRDLRYGEFRRLLSESGADRIAVAHNAGDQAETVILNLMRGTGICGLRAMLPDTGEIIRPLLGVSRETIEKYLKEKGIGWHEDSTNTDSAYLRNFVRHEVLPLLRQKWPLAESKLCRAAKALRSDELMLDYAEAQLLGSSSRLPYDVIRKVPVSGWLIRKFAIRYGANEDQVLEMERLYNAAPDVTKSGKKWFVPQGEIRAERDGFYFVAESGTQDPGVEPSAEPNAELMSQCYVISPQVVALIKKSSLNDFWISLSPKKIKLRPWRKEDKIKLFGGGGTATVSQILKDAKLTAEAKKRVVVAVHSDTDEILWIPGLKRSAHYPVKLEAFKGNEIVWQYRLEFR